MIDKILKFADEFNMLPASGLVLACVSGGADSMCLLEALLDISRERGFSVGVAHYNHGLRGGESERDEEFVKNRCGESMIRFFRGGGDVRAYAREHGLGIEEAARDLRYSFFYETAEREGAVRIATAHTADDNTETMIFNLTRGAGAAGLSGIPPVRGPVIRPMLNVTRDDVMRFAKERGVLFVEDSTNNLTVFARNKLRHSVVPILKEINPRVNEAAATAAALVRADDEYLSGVADEFIRERCDSAHSDTKYCGAGRCDTERCDTERCDAASCNAADIAGLPLAISGRVIRKLSGRNLSYRHVKAVLELCGRDAASAKLSLPGFTVFRQYERIVFGLGPVPLPDTPKGSGCVNMNMGGNPIPASAGFEPVRINVGDNLENLGIPGLGLSISCKSVICDGTINKSFTSFLFKNIDIYGKMTVRSRLEGDTIRLLGRNGTKSLKKLFIERRVPVAERPLVPVVADDNGVLAVYSLGVGDRAVPKPGDRAFQIEFLEA